MEEFVTPAFLLNHSAEENHELMRSILPADIDLSEGSHGWNLTRPSALLAAYWAEYVLPEVIKLIFPQWSYGDYLDVHAKARRITRRSATAASGELTITGAATTLIPAGSLFSTAAVNDAPSVDYKTLAEVTIPESGSITVAIECTKTGIIGNTAANTIVLISGRNTGVTAVTNENPITGGTEIEDDESLIARIDAYDKSLGESFTGCVADYKRWALEVDGVGEAAVVPAQDDSGLVTIILTDTNGDPATQNLCTQVYNHIMRPDNPEVRLANVNAHLSVVPPSTIAIAVKATVKLESGATIESVKAAFLANLTKYLPEAMDAKEVKYSRVWAVLSATAGVDDLTGLQIGEKVNGEATYGTGNIAITAAELPTVATDDLVLTEGTV